MRPGVAVLSEMVGEGENRGRAAVEGPSGGRAAGWTGTVGILGPNGWVLTRGRRAIERNGQALTLVHFARSRRTEKIACRWPAPRYFPARWSGRNTTISAVRFVACSGADTKCDGRL